MEMDEALFDRIAAAELDHLQKAFEDVDPDEVDADFGLDVLTLTLADGNKIVINSHRAARQIWMAAFRRAWHFTPRQEPGGAWTWHTATDELRATLAALLGEKLGHPIAI
jgi:CyaY protein